MDNSKAKEELKKIYQSIGDIQYGTVTVHIQDGKIVYIEKTERIKIKD